MFGSLKESRIRLGLGRVRRVLRALGDPHESVPVIHVAGTNAKGSVCMFLARLLEQRALRVGLYTSPHIRSITERIQINGRMISPRALAALGKRVRRAGGEAKSRAYVFRADHGGGLSVFCRPTG